MQIEIIKQNGVPVAAVSGEGTLIIDGQSALELLVGVQYEAGSARIAIAKDAVAEEFFVLGSGLAGEVLQKFSNYHGKLAIYGDFSRYTSKPLRDFIRESNRGRDIFFVPTLEKAVEQLSLAE